MSEQQPSKQLSVADLRKSREATSTQTASPDPPFPSAAAQPRRNLLETPPIEHEPQSSRRFELSSVIPPWLIWLFSSGGVFFLLLFLRVIKPHLDRTATEKLLSEDPYADTLATMMDIAVQAHSSGEVQANDFLSESGEYMVTDRWEVPITLEAGGVLRSVGRDVEANTGDDITLDIVGFTYSTPEPLNEKALGYIESAWPTEYHGRFRALSAP